MDKDLFDTNPFAYVGNNKYYEEITKEELPSSTEVEENSASVVGQMIPQIALSSTEEPDIDHVLADVEDDTEALNEVEIDDMEDIYIDDEFDLLKESLEDTELGGELYFESSKFIESLKNKFKKDKSDDITEINYDKVMKVARLYTDMRVSAARLKLSVVKDYKVKGTPEYRELQKKAVLTEKDYRKFKKGLNKDELKYLNDYIEGFESTFNKKVELQIADIKAAKKAAFKKEYVEYKDDNDIINIITESFKDDFYIEGANWDLHKKYREDLKVVRHDFGTCLKHLKSHNYDGAREVLKGLISVTKKCKEDALKEIEKIDDDKIITAICGFMLRNVSIFCRDILLLLLCAPLAAVRELIDTVKDLSNVSKNYQEKGYFKAGDFNTYVQFVEKDYDRIIHVLESFLNKIDKFEKDYKEKEDLKKESCETECGTTEIVTERDLDPAMKPLIEKLHKKGYKTKASSSGHKNVITKDDADKDNIRDGHHYGDARLVFDGKYDLGKAPKYWYWKKVDNADEVEYLDVMQISGNETPDTEEKFNNWKNNYMKSLTDWVDDLPDISNESCCKESFADINSQIDILYESVLGNLELDIMDI